MTVILPPNSLAQFELKQMILEDRAVATMDNDRNDVKRSAMVRVVHK
jgi:hypothetical protein